MLLIIFALFVPYGKAAEKQKASVRMEARPNEVYQGESFILKIYCDGFDNPAKPDMSYLSSEFQLEDLGAENRNSTMITIVNGQQSRIEDRGITYNFRLTPKASGRIRIEPPIIKDGNRTLTITPIEIEVVPPGKQDLVGLEMSGPKKEIYPLIPFRISLTVYVKALPGKYQDRDPVLAIADHTDPGALYIPWMEDGKLEKGLIPSKNWEDWIMSFRNTNGGFIVNNIRINDPFDFGFSMFQNRSRSALFLPPGQKTERKIANGQKISCWKYVFEREFQAEKPGEFSFDPASMKGVFASGNDDSSLKPENIYVISSPLTVRVKDVPEENRPKDYIGAFGEFTWKADFTPKKVRVGEALTLTLALEGTGSLLQVKPPLLESIPEIAKNFKVYPPSENITKNKAVFTWSIRALKAGKITFPAVPISYFDVKSEKFVSISSDPIPIQADPSEVLSTGTVPQNRKMSKSIVLTRSSEGIFANLTDPNGAINQKIALRDWVKNSLILFGSAFFFFCAVQILKKGKIASFRKQRENAHIARSDFQEGIRMLEQSGAEDPSLAASKIRNAFLVPVQEYFNRSIDTLTASETDAFLVRLSAQKNGAFLPDIRRLFEQLEELRYGHEKSTLLEIIRTAPALFEEWNEFLSERRTRKFLRNLMKKNKNDLSALKMILILSGILFCGITGCSSADQNDQKAFNEAIRVFDEAEQKESGLKEKTAQDKENEQKSDDARDLFLKSAAIYQGIIDRGTESGPLFYNQGNAYYRAGEKAKALACWRKAARYMPQNSYLISNIEMVAPKENSVRPLFELIFFWQNRIGYPAKYQLSVLSGIFAFAGFLGLLLFSLMKKDLSKKEAARYQRKRRFCLNITLIFGLLFAILSTSFLYDIYRFDYRQYGIVQAKEAIPRKGNSLQYEPLYKEALPELSTVSLLEDRGNWYRVKFSDQQEGWLQKKDLLVY
ncbi:MAG: BatD family protein [Planctomycetia bacterium]|nr:BatD family protein [Planctomycetia bacterium]